MTPYAPFLLPLLPETAAAGPCTSPLGEEALLGKLPAPGPWERLREAVPRAYGLPLVVSLDPGIRPRVPDGCRAHTCPGRCLVAGDRFLIEHPDGLALFDRFASPGQAVALARPSCFSASWRQACQETEDGRIAGQGPAAGGVVAPPAEALGTFLEELRARGPSDWHLEPTVDGYRSRLRINGRLTGAVAFSRERGQWLVQSLIAAAGIRPEGTGKPLEGRLHQVPASGTPLNLRLSFIPSLYGRALVARFLDPPPGNAEETDPLETADGGRTEGLWLVAGPTGSGKTTTLHTRLRARVRAGEKVLSVEDPVEALLPGVHQVSVGSPPGMGFALALRAFLRQSPDCILVGEIRDGETAGVALQAARTGHRILSTLHARNNAGVLRRFADLGQSPDALLGLRPVVLHQRLLPRLCSRCQRTEPLPGNWRRGLEALGLEAPDRIPARGGCPLCREGIAGRLPIRSSGIFAPERDSDRELLLAGWEAVLAGQITPGALAPLLPGVLRRRFALSGP